MAANYEMEGHLVLCHWAPRGIDWIREVHSRIVIDRKAIVIIHDRLEEIELPDKQDEPAFHDVYLIKGDPTNEVVLKRARITKASSVVILADDRQGDYADGKTILTCIAIQNTCRGPERPNIAAECRNARHRDHLRKSGADEVLSSEELGLNLLARAAHFHGVTDIYQELLTLGRDANEMYLLPLHPALVGRDFTEAAGMFLRHRDDKRACLVLGVQRDGELILNPIGADAGPLGTDDQLIVLARSYPNPSQSLPTEPPLPPALPRN